MYFPPVPFVYMYGQEFIFWKDVLWAYQVGLVNQDFVVGLADKHLISGSYCDLELDLALMDNVRDIEESLISLASEEDCGLITMDSKSKWIFVAIKWIFENRECVQDPLGEVERVYADFDYPGELEGLVRYMPCSDGYRPEDHSSAENQERLYHLWGAYVKNTELALQVSND